MNIIARIFEANGESVCEMAGVRIFSSPGGAGELFEKYVRRGTEKAQARARARASTNYRKWSAWAQARHTPGAELPSWPDFLAFRRAEEVADRDIAYFCTRVPHEQWPQAALAQAEALERHAKDGADNPEEALRMAAKWRAAAW